MARPGGFKEGHSKAGGRVKGTPNKDNETVAQTCERMGLNVAEAMIHLAINTEDELIKASMLKELASYLYAKKKAIEVSGSLGVDTSRQDAELAKLREQVKARISERK
jgi:hypothetical protein